QRIIRATRTAERRIEIEAGPRLHHRVDIEHTELTAEPDEIERRGVHRQVDAKALAGALRQQRREQLPVIFPRHTGLDEANAALIQQRAVGVHRVYDGHARFVVAEMTLDERQRATPDRAEADHD